MSSLRSPCGFLKKIIGFPEKELEFLKEGIDPLKKVNEAIDVLDKVMKTIYFLKEASDLVKKSIGFFTRGKKATGFLKTISEISLGKPLNSQENH